LKKKVTETKGNNSIPFLEANKSNLSLEFSRYSIKEELGRGSMGRIYKAYDLKLERYVALKLIHLETDMHKDEIEERIRRFLLEAKATANLNHPNIVSLYDYDEKDGIFYMTMELIVGESLQEMIKNLKRIEIESALEIIKQICSALEYAHKQNIIHRDIKPSNIIINRDGRVKILDFGLAKIINLSKDESCTVTGMRVGSPSYMSPEQINSNTLDVRSDIFSLGIVFYEMLTSVNPFRIKKGESLSRLFYLILN
jgi:serine/threonine-protein kinase